MIIVSQDKKEIINFDKIKNIKLDPVLDCRNIIVNLDSVYTDIGSYKTEERSKEVLQEIVMLFKDEEMFHIRKSTLNNLDELAEPKYILKPVSRPKVYEMPLE